MKTVGLVSLGCDKNRVDSENVLYSLSKAGYKIVQNPADAEVIIVNTCAFIESAKKESIDAILEYAGYKNGGCKKLVVIGCLAERYADELTESLPEVDVYAGVNSYHKIAEIIESGNKIEKNPLFTPYERGRVITTPYHYAYLKIAEGCNNRCSYCAIPYIRGNYRSAPIEELMKEADGLAEQGVKELVVVAQDITAYGRDIYGKYALKDLIKELTEKDFEKIRLMYAYPELIDDGLIEMIASEDKIAKYIDIPLQHISDGVLKRMRRRTNKSANLELIKRIRAADAEIAIRSSFIVGFPGETEEEFAELKEFIADGNIDYAGFFTYSREEGTPAYSMENQITAKLKKARQTELSKLQSLVITEKHKSYLGKTIRVLYEGIDYKKEMFWGRNEQNAPEVDTKVFFKSKFPLDIGEYYDVTVTSSDFNLYGETTD